MGALMQTLPTLRVAELGWGWPPRGWADGASLRVAGAHGRNHVDQQQHREDGGLHHCLSTNVTTSVPASLTVSCIQTQKGATAARGARQGWAERENSPCACGSVDPISYSCCPWLHRGWMRTANSAVLLK